MVVTLPPVMISVPPPLPLPYAWLTAHSLPPRASTLPPCRIKSPPLSPSLPPMFITGLPSPSATLLRLSEFQKTVPYPKGFLWE